MVPIGDPLEVFVKKVGITEESELQIKWVFRIIQRFFFLFLNKNICCDPSLEPSP